MSLETMARSAPVLLSVEETEAVHGGISPLVAAGAFAAGVAVGTAAVAIGAAAGVAYVAATSSGSDDKKPIIAPGT